MQIGGHTSIARNKLDLLLIKDCFYEFVLQVVVSDGFFDSVQFSFIPLKRHKLLHFELKFLTLVLSK